MREESEDISEFVINYEEVLEKFGDRYPIRVLVIGIPNGVTSVIHELHVKLAYGTVARIATVLR